MCLNLKNDCFSRSLKTYCAFTESGVFSCCVFLTGTEAIEALDIVQDDDCSMTHEFEIHEQTF